MHFHSTFFPVFCNKAVHLFFFSVHPLILWLLPLIFDTLTARSNRLQRVFERDPFYSDAEPRSTLKELVELTPPMCAVQHTTQRSLVHPTPASVESATESRYRRPLSPGIYTRFSVHGQVTLQPWVTCPGTPRRLSMGTSSSLFHESEALPPEEHPLETSSPVHRFHMHCCASPSGCPHFLRHPSLPCPTAYGWLALPTRPFV